MENITIDKREYYIKTSFDELTAYEYYKLITIKNKPVKEEYTKEELEVKKTYSDDSDGFYRRYGHIYTSKQKGIDLIRCISNISKKYLKSEEYPIIYKISLDVVLSSLNNLLTPISKDRTYYDIKGERYYIDYKITDWPFIKWCECENAFKNISTHTLLGFYATVLQVKNTKFDMYQNDFVDKLEYLKNLSAIEVVSSLDRLLKEVDKIRQSNHFVYNNPYPSTGNENSGELLRVLQNIGWHDKIIQIAQTPVFNGPNGTLEAVKNAKTIEVLHYLNIKNAREMAEAEDSRKALKQMKKKR